MEQMLVLGNTKANWELGITIMVASIAFYSVYDNDTVTVIMALIGLCISLHGYFKKEK